MDFLLAFLWGVATRLRHIREFPSALFVAWTDKRYASDRILLSIQLVWFIWLINPLFNTFEAATGYRKMAELMSEEWWAVLMLGLSVLHIDSMIHSNHRVRRNVALIEMGVWVFIAWMFAVSNINGLGMPVYGIVAWHFFLIFRRRV